MSWKVDDEQWLAPIQPEREIEVFDELDARVLEQLMGPPSAPTEPPPPPPSAAFENSSEPTSYESGKFVVDEVVEDRAHDEPSMPAPMEEAVVPEIPSLVRSAPSVEPPAIPPLVRSAPSVEPPAIPPLVRSAPSVEPPAIPPLVRSAPTVEPPAIPPLVRSAPTVEPPAIPPLVRSAPTVEPPAIPPLVRSAPTVEPPAIPPLVRVVADAPASEEAEEAEVSIPSLTRATAQSEAQSEFVIPTLRRDVEVAPEPASEPAPAQLDVELHAAGRAFPVDAGASEAVEEVEVDEVEEVEEAPVRTGDTVIGPPPSAPEPAVVMPTLVAAPAVNSVAASVYDDDEGGEVEVASPEPVAGVDSAELEILPEDEDTAVGYPPEEEPEPQGGITPAEIVLPMLAHIEPSDEEVALVRDDDEPDLDEVAEVEEVDADVDERPRQPEPDAPEQRRPPPPTEKRRKAWYDDVFAEHFVFLHPPSWEETARRDAKFIHEVLGVREGAAMLDVGCGDGRHAIELGKLGMRVIGLDNSLAMLLAAAQHKEQAGMDERVSFLHGDMRRLPRDRQFDAVICIGSTFGYFEEDQNRVCLEEMIGRLAPGGRLLLHVFNRDFVAPQLPARSWWQGRRCMVLDEAEMNFFANRLRIHRTIIFDDGRQFEHYMFLRAFTVHDLGKTLSQMGMRVVEVSGSRDTRKRFYGSASPEIWIVAEHKT